MNKFRFKSKIKFIYIINESLEEFKYELSSNGELIEKLPLPSVRTKYFKHHIKKKKSFRKANLNFSSNLNNNINFENDLTLFQFNENSCFKDNEEYLFNNLLLN